MLEDILKAAERGDAETAGALLVAYFAAHEIGWSIENGNSDNPRLTLERRRRPRPASDM